LYQTLSQLLRPPDLVVYLKASVPTLQRRIAQRGRHYEQSIAPDYLTNLNQLYDDWVAGFKLCPILTVDSDKLDYVQNDEHLLLIVNRIRERLYGQDYLALGD
jgi:deoxyadenosine/deoxycytidine kinase